MLTDLAVPYSLPPPARSTLMEVESTVSSGRSTPAMLTGILGGPASAANPASSAKGPAYPCCWDRCLESFCSSPDLAEHIRGMHADSQRGGVGPRPRPLPIPLSSASCTPSQTPPPSFCYLGLCLITCDVLAQPVCMMPIYMLLYLISYNQLGPES